MRLPSPAGYAAYFGLTLDSLMKPSLTRRDRWQDMAGSETGSRGPGQMARVLRLAAVQVLLAEPDEIPDDLEESLYAYRDRLEGQARS